MHKFRSNDEYNMAQRVYERLVVERDISLKDAYFDEAFNDACEIAQYWFDHVRVGGRRRGRAVMPEDYILFIAKDVLLNEYLERLNLQFRRFRHALSLDADLDAVNELNYLEVKDLISRWKELSCDIAPMYHSNEESE